MPGVSRPSAWDISLGPLLPLCPWSIRVVAVSVGGTKPPKSVGFPSWDPGRQMDG